MFRRQRCYPTSVCESEVPAVQELFHVPQRHTVIHTEAHPPKRLVSRKREKFPLMAHSAGCGKGHYDLVIGVLASPSRRSRAARETLRETWFQFGSPKGYRVLYRFILALNSSNMIPESLAVCFIPFYWAYTVLSLIIVKT